MTVISMLHLTGMGSKGCKDADVTPSLISPPKCEVLQEGTNNP